VSDLLPPVVGELSMNISPFSEALRRARGELSETADDAKLKAHEIDDSAASAGKSGGGFLSGIGGAATGVVAGIALAGGALADFAVKSADKFAEVGGEVIQLQRYTGLSAVAASQLRFAAEESGVGVDQLSNGLKFLSKDMAKGPDLFRFFGIAATDAKGHMLPLNQVLLNTADQIAKMPNGWQKNTEVVKLFGRAGMQLLPMLNRGKSGLQDLEKQAGKYGLVLNQSNVGAVRKSIQAHREFSAAMSGLQVTIGEYVLPIITQLTSWLAQHLPGAIAWVKQKLVELHPWFEKIGQVVSTVVGWLERHRGAAVALGIAIGALVAPVATLVAGVIYAYTHWRWFKTVVDDVAKFLTTKVWPAIQAFYQNFQLGVQVISDWWRAHWDTIRATVRNAWDFISSIVRSSFQVVEGIFNAALDIIHGRWGKAWDDLKGALGAAWNGIKKLVTTSANDLVAIIKGIGPDLYNIGQNLIDSLWRGIESMGSSLQNDVTSFISDHVPGPIKSLLGISSPSKVMVGFGANIAEGLAIGITGGAGRVAGASAGLANAALIPPSGPGYGGGGSTPGGNSGVVINITGALDPVAVGRQVSDVLARYGQAGGVIHISRYVA